MYNMYKYSIYYYPIYVLYVHIVSTVNLFTFTIEFPYTGCLKVK